MSERYPWEPDYDFVRDGLGIDMFGRSEPTMADHDERIDQIYIAEIMRLRQEIARLLARMAEME